MGVLTLVRTAATELGSMEECPKCGKWKGCYERACPNCIEEELSEA